MAKVIYFARIRSAVERRLQNRRFWRDSSLLMLANVIGIGLGLIRTPVLTWLLPKDEVGMIGVVAAWQAFLLFLTWPSSLSTAAYHYVSKGQTAAYTVMLKQQLRWSLLTVLGFCASAAYWWWQSNQTLAILFVLGGITYPLTIVLAACSEVLAAQEKFVGLFWYRIGQYLAHLVGFIPLLLSVWWVSRVVTFYGANQLSLGLLHVGLTAWLLWQFRRSQPPPMPDEDQKEMRRYGKHLTGINALSAIQARADQLLVATLLPLATVADYTIAVLAYEQLKRLWSMYVTLRYPPFVRLPVERRLRRMWQEGIVVWLGFIGLGLAAGYLASVLVPLLLPPSYSGSLGFIYWSIAALVVILPGAFVEVFFRTEQDAKRQYVMRLVSGILAVVLPLSLVFNWGAYGVLLGRFLANLMFSVVGIYLVRQKKGVS